MHTTASQVRRLYKYEVLATADHVGQVGEIVWAKDMEAARAIAADLFQGATIDRVECLEHNPADQ